MKKVLADIRLSEKCESTLRAFGYEVFRLPPFFKLPSPVASHPDMLVFVIFGKVFCHHSYFEKAVEEFEKIKKQGYEIITTSQPISDKYPNDILFNVAHVGKFIFANAKHISRQIVMHTADSGLETVNVRQGYARCSMCIVSENAVITADAGIADACLKNNVSLLRLPDASALLQGYNKGFIGGASGFDNENVYFTGSLLSLGDEAAKKITEFCAAHSKKAVSLSDEPLYDYGSLIFI